MKTNRRPGKGFIRRASLAIVVEDDPAPTNDEEAPERPEEGVAELSVEILADEDDDAEVGVEAVTDEEGREDEEPGSLAGQKLLLDLGKGGK